MNKNQVKAAVENEYVTLTLVEVSDLDMLHLLAVLRRDSRTKEMGEHIKAALRRAGYGSLSNAACPSPNQSNT